jgi:hypothetical protein
VTGFDKEELNRETVDCFFARDDSWPTLRLGEQSLGVKFYGALYNMVHGSDSSSSGSSSSSDRSWSKSRTRSSSIGGDKDGGNAEGGKDEDGKDDDAISKDNIGTALILEDDIWMEDSSFEEYFGNLLQALPPDFDVVHLGDCLGYKDMWRAKFVAPGLAKPVSEHGNARLFAATNAPCSHAMLVSRAGAFKLLQHALPMTRPLDQHIEYYTKIVTLLNAYYSERDLFWQESQQARSGTLAESTGIRDR